MMAPKAKIRRFDIFAEYNRIKNEQKEMASDRAKGYAIWLAKVVAARKFARTPATREKMTEQLAEGGKEIRAGAEYPELGGQPQTGAVFDKVIIDRMGQEFYQQVFSPAIARAIEEHRSYEAIRDSLREPWNQEYEQQHKRGAAA